MNKSEALSYFNNSVSELAGALGISSASISQWGEKIPPLRAYQIKEIVEARRLLAPEKDDHAA